MRKTITLFLTILLVLNMAGFAYAEPANITEALATANDELKIKNDGGNYFFTQNVQGKPINESNWAKWGVFSYGTPQEASPGSNNYDPGTNRYRYHGYTMNNEKYTNTFFRNDTTETVDVNSANWIPMPWRDPAVQNFVTNVMHEPKLESNNPFNNDPALLQSIILGMENVTLYNPYIKFKTDNRQWQEYVHILQPPTKYVFGMGRLFRIVDGQMRYLTIPLTPLTLTADPDFSVALEVEKFQNVKPGDKITSTVTYKLNQDHSGAERAWLRLHHQVGTSEYPVKLEPLNPADAPDSNGYVTFQPGESKTYRYTFTVQSSSKKIIARINPVDSANDKDWNNNRDEAVILSRDNLWVEIIDYTKEAQVGGTATVRARIHNERGELLTSRLVWKVNGVIMKDIPNYDIIGTLENSLTFTMPKDSATVTVEINPDRDKPANESSYEDNKATCTVKPIAVVIPPDNESNRLKIKISAPSRVKAFYEKWKYTVTVTTNYPPPPPPAPGEPKPKPPIITMNVSATGQTADMEVGYQIWNDGYQKIIPVKKTDKKVFSAGWGYREHKFIYEYPNTGLWGKPVTVTIKADAVSSGGQSARDTAIVIINPHPIPQTETVLIR